MEKIKKSKIPKKGEKNVFFKNYDRACTNMKCWKKHFLSALISGFFSLDEILKIWAICYTNFFKKIQMPC